MKDGAPPFGAVHIGAVHNCPSTYHVLQYRDRDYHLDACELHESEWSEWKNT